MYLTSAVVWWLAWYVRFSRSWVHNFFLSDWRDLHFHEHFQLKISSKCDIKAENSSTLCKFHKGRKVLRPRGFKTYGSRAFAVSAPELWHKLPDDIRSCANLSLFNHKLKRYLFKNYYFSHSEDLLAFVCVLFKFKFILINFLKFSFFSLR